MNHKVGMTKCAGKAQRSALMNAAASAQQLMNITRRLYKKPACKLAEC